MRVIESYSTNILQLSKSFAIDIVNLSAYLPKNPAGFAIAGQIVRSATSIGANLVEAQESISHNDFVYKLNISLKEAKETLYWLEIISGTQLIEEKKIQGVVVTINQIIKILVASVKKLRQK